MSGCHDTYSTWHKIMVYVDSWLVVVVVIVIVIVIVSHFCGPMQRGELRVSIGHRGS